MLWLSCPQFLFTGIGPWGNLQPTVCMQACNSWLRFQYHDPSSKPKVWPKGSPKLAQGTRLLAQALKSYPLFLDKYPDPRAVYSWWPALWLVAHGSDNSLPGECSLSLVIWYYDLVGACLHKLTFCWCDSCQRWCNEFIGTGWLGFKDSFHHWSWLLGLNSWFPAGGVQCGSWSLNLKPKLWVCCQ